MDHSFQFLKEVPFQSSSKASVTRCNISRQQVLQRRVRELLGYLYKGFVRYHCFSYLQRFKSGTDTCQGNGGRLNLLATSV